MVKYKVFKRLKMEGISYEKSIKKNLCGWGSTRVEVGCGGDRVGFEHFCLFNIYNLRLNLVSLIGFL